MAAHPRRLRAAASTRSASSGASTATDDRPARWSRCTTPTATGTPTSSTRTPQGRARTDKQMYVSPFHGVDGTYELAVPAPDDRLTVAVTLHTDDGAVFSAVAHRRDGSARRRPDDWPRSHGTRRHPRGAPDPNARCVALGAPTPRPAPTRPTTKQECHDPRPVVPRRCDRRGPIWPCVPSGPRAAVSAVVARRLFRSAVAPAARHRHHRLGEGRTEVARPRRPDDDRAPARRVLRPAGPRTA